jgi:hypothetical protein
VREDELDGLESSSKYGRERSGGNKRSRSSSGRYPSRDGEDPKRQNRRRQQQPLGRDEELDEHSYPENLEPSPHQQEQSKNRDSHHAEVPPFYSSYDSQKESSSSNRKRKKRNRRGSSRSKERTKARTGAPVDEREGGTGSGDEDARRRRDSGRAGGGGRRDSLQTSTTSQHGKRGRTVSPDPSRIVVQNRKGNSGDDSGKHNFEAELEESHHREEQEQQLSGEESSRRAQPAEFGTMESKDDHEESRNGSGRRRVKRAESSGDADQLVSEKLEIRDRRRPSAGSPQELLRKELAPVLSKTSSSGARSERSLSGSHAEKASKVGPKSGTGSSVPSRRGRSRSPRGSRRGSDASGSTSDTPVGRKRVREGSSQATSDNDSQLQSQVVTSRRRVLGPPVTTSSGDDWRPQSGGGGRGRPKEGSQLKPGQRKVVLTSSGGTGNKSKREGGREKLPMKTDFYTRKKAAALAEEGRSIQIRGGRGRPDRN